MLKRLTRPDFAKVFRKRTNSNVPILKTPVYKFLTDEELNIEREKANKSADRLLQMPPVVKVILISFISLDYIRNKYINQKILTKCTLFDIAKRLSLHVYLFVLFAYKVVLSLISIFKINLTLIK